MKKLIIFALLLASSFLSAQSLTTVTATITDPSGQAFVAGTVQADYQRPAGKAGVTPLSNGVPIVEHGAPLFAPLDTSGTFTISVADLSTVSPTGGYWVFTICPNASAPCTPVKTASVVGASVNLTTELSASIIPTIVPAQPTLARAYRDSEVVITPSIVWLDVTLNALKYVDALDIIHIIGGGGGGGTVTDITATVPIIATPNPITTIGNISCPTCLTTTGNGVTGTGVAQELALWSGPHTLIGLPQLVYTTLVAQVNLQVGKLGSNIGALDLCHDSGASCSRIQPQLSSGIGPFFLPDGSASGTFAINATPPLVLNPVTGMLTCPTCAAGLAPQYKELRCETGLGDGLNSMPSGTYLQSFCYNDSGVTWTITGIRCFTDNNGTSTLNASGNILGALLTGPITCTNSFATGTQSANVLLTSGDYIKFTFVADATSKQTTWVVGMTQ